MTFLFAIGCMLSAAAADPQPAVHVEKDGTIIGRMVVDSPVAEVLEVVSEVQRTKANANVLEIRFTPDGACTSIFRKTRGILTPLELRTRLCPTANGWRESLVHSDSFDAYETEWVIRPMGTGSASLEFSIRSNVNLMVPSGLIQQNTISGVRASFTEIIGRLLKRRRIAN